MENIRTRQLEAEIERLRAALARITDYVDEFSETKADIIAQARAALEKK